MLMLWRFKKCRSIMTNCQNLVQEPQTLLNISHTHAESEIEGQSFLQCRGKRLKSAFIILAKASHHKLFMETCLSRNTPPTQHGCLGTTAHLPLQSRSGKAMEGYLTPSFLRPNNHTDQTLQPNNCIRTENSWWHKTRNNQTPKGHTPCTNTWKSKAYVEGNN